MKECTFFGWTVTLSVSSEDYDEPPPGGLRKCSAGILLP